MTKTNKLSILTMVILVTTIVIFAIAIFSIINIRIANKNITSIYIDRVLPLEQLKRVSDAYREGIEGSAYKTFHGNISWDSARHAIYVNGEQIRKNWTSYLDTYLTVEEKQKVEQAEALKVKADLVCTNLTEILKKGNNFDNQLVLDQFIKVELCQNIEPFISKVNELISIQMKETANLKSLTETVFKRIVVLSVLVIIACFIVVWLIKYKGNLEKRVLIQTKELEELNCELNTAIEELQTTNEELDVNNEELTTTNEELSAVNEQLAESNALLERYKNNLEELVTQRTAALEESEQKYRYILERAPLGIFQRTFNDSSYDAKYDFCNLTLAKKFGCDTVEEFINDYSNATKRWAELDKMEIFNRLLKENGEVNGFEVKTRLKDGTIKWFLLSAKLDVSNMIMSGFVQDITERRQYEDALISSKTFMHTLINTIPDLVWFKDKAGVYLQCNKRFEDLFGSTEQEIIGKTDYYFVRKDLAEFFRKNDIAAMDALKPTMNEEQVTFADGHSETLETIKTPILSSDGEVIGVLGIGRDITERKRHVLQLAESQVKLLSIINSTNDMIWAVESENLTLITFNSALKKYYNDRGVNLHLGMTQDELLPDQPRQMWIDFYRRAMIEGPFETEYKTITNNQYLSLKFSNLINEGKIFGISVFARNITERKLAEEKIYLSESKYRRLHTSMTDGFALVNMEGKIVEFNEAYLKMLGYTPEELLTLTYFDITPQEWYNFENEIIENQVLKIGYSEVYEKEYIRKDGTIFPVELRAYLYKNETEGNEGMWAIVRDVSDRKHAENIIKAEKERAARYLNIAGVILVACDMEGCITLINRKGNELLGYQEGELLGQNWYKTCLPPDEFEIVYAVFKRIMSGEIEMFEYFENNIINRYGEERNIAWHNTIIRDDSGKIIGTLSSGEDITDRRQAEIALKESEERYRLIAMLSGHMVYEYFSDDNSLKWDGAIEQVTGYTPDEYKSINLEKYALKIHPEDLEPTIVQFKNAIANNTPYNSEYRYLNKNNDYIWIENECFALNVKNNKVLKAIGVMKDITAKKNMERQILNSVIETEERERMNFSQELHDGLGPLLSAIKMYVQWLATSNANIDRAEILKDIEKLLDESSKTVREISFKLSPHILQNYGLLEALEAYIEKIKEKCNINFEVEAKEILRFDEKVETIIYRVICECITNTLKHAQADTIVVKLNFSTDALIVEYLDNGIGFNVEQILSSYKGIGLLNMQSRVKSINGNMSILSQPGKGTSINFKIFVSPIENHFVN